MLLISKLKTDFNVGDMVWVAFYTSCWQVSPVRIEISSFDLEGKQISQEKSEIRLYANYKELSMSATGGTVETCETKTIPILTQYLFHEREDAIKYCEEMNVKK